MNKNYLFLMLISATLMFCCITAASYAQSGTSKSPNNKTLTGQAPQIVTNYGVLTIRPNNIDNKLVSANNLLVNYVRETQLLSKWNGTNNSYIDFWLKHDKKVCLNINNDSTPSSFPKNLTPYTNKLKSFLDVYASSLEFVVIENEELDRYDSATSVSNLYHFGSMQDYINELTVAVTECNLRGVPVTNGGLTTPLVSSLKHYYDINGKADSSAWLVTQMGGVSPDSSLWKRTDSLLAAYKTLNLAFVNLHWYEPLKNKTTLTYVLPVLCKYITQQTGKKVITNETGIKKNDSSFVTPLLKEWDSVNVKYCIFFDGSGAFGAYPLTSSNGDLLATGVAFRNYVFGATTSCPQTINISPAGPINLCSGGNIVLTATAGFSNYLWNTGGTTRTNTVNLPGNYSVTSNLGNCIAFSTNTVIVNINPLPVKPTITTNVSPTNICPGKTVKLTSSAASAYLWSSGQTTKVITVSAAGNYSVTITDANGCKNTSDPKVVTYQTCTPPANLHVTAIAKNKATLNWDTVVCAVGYQYQYRQKGTTPWTTVTLTGRAASSRTVLSLTPSTTYQWKIRTHCQTTPDTIASIYATGPEFTTTATFAIAGTEQADAFTTHNFAATVFPNPATNTATVTVNNTENLKIVLTDLSGKVFWQSEKITGNSIDIPVQHLASGLYIITVKNKEGGKMIKFVKE